MTDPTLNVETLARRLAKVERENRRVRWAGGGVALLLTFSLLTGATKTPTEIDVRRLRILDGDGKVRAGLWVDKDKDEPILLLTNANEKPRAMLVGTKNGGALSLFDADVKGWASLGVNKDGQFLGLTDANGKLRAGLSVVKGEPTLALFDANEKLIWSAPSGATGEGR